MLRPTVGRVTVIILLVATVAGAGIWLAIGYGAIRVSKTVATRIDHLPHGPRPGPAKLR